MEDITNILRQVDLLTFENKKLFNSCQIDKEIRRLICDDLKKAVRFVLVNSFKLIDNSPSGSDGYGVLQQVQSLI